MAHPTRTFKTPKELEKAWEEFKKDVIEQSKEWLKVDYVGKDGARVAEPTKVPYTLEGFKRYCRVNHGEVHHYFVNTENYYDEFCTICHVIKDEIRENQIIGGMLGFHNPSITQRLNNLKEQSEVVNTQNIKLMNLDPLNDEND